eukprot:TRINITY_DN7399_c0_g1_i1.p2 TRINITY_DN7399_c0_g1~~TRINITY_DN7399_c0_g1_i1.p2  ORF type:complete len:113 (+),score=21.40 TRINITY_DN7399_c0_g1_i1:581-919(+)
MLKSQLGSCERCGEKLIEKHGRYGKFYACSNRPECTFSTNNTATTTSSSDDSRQHNIYDFLYNQEEPDLKDRLEELLDYMRTIHYYCYYCGSRYDDENQLTKYCPGKFEESH